jgi:hypothetical protein
MIETLVGGLLGGVFRLAPEVLKWLDRKGERGHELAMQEKALEFEKLRGATRMAEISAGALIRFEMGRCTIDQCSSDHHLLVYGALLCCEDGRVRRRA